MMFTCYVCLFVCLLAWQSPVGQGLLIHEVSSSHTQRPTTFSRAPLDKWSARRRDLYLITHNTHNRQTSMPPVGFEPTFSAGERPQIYASRTRGHWDRHLLRRMQKLRLSRNKSWRSREGQNVGLPALVWHSAQPVGRQICQLYAPATLYPKGNPLVLLYVRGWVDSMATAYGKEK